MNDLVDDVGALLEGPGDADGRRYTKGSLDLLEIERGKLSDGLRLGQEEEVASALRSLGGMMKGLLDIGACWMTDRPDLAQRASRIIDASREVARCERERSLRHPPA